MRVIASVAVSLDGCMDDCTPRRLVLSSPEDWTEVYRLRASCDAILAGAGTLCADNPSLLSKGAGPDPLRVTISRRGDLDTSLKFFTGPGRPLVFVEKGGERLRGVADVVETGYVTPEVILTELARRGVKRLMVEGGAQTLRMFFEAGAVDELRLAVAPFFVGDPAAPRFAGMGQMKLRSVERLGQTTVMHLITPDEYYLRQAIEESRKCAPSETAYSVGAVIATAAGEVYTGFTGETGPHDHAEEAAISKALAGSADLGGATMYSSMEPCSVRKSKPESCSALIIRHGFARAVFAYYEPLNFVDGQGAQVLHKAGIEVKAMDELAHEVIAINKHIIK